MTVPADPSVLARRERDDAIVADLRAHGGRPSNGAAPLVILFTTGERSGRTHEKPVCVREDGQDLIIAASAGGQPLHPQWYRNLVVTPDMAVEYLGELFPVRASTVANSLDRNRLFDLMSEEITGIYGYQDRCRDHRQIPVVRLTRLPAVST